VCRRMFSFGMLGLLWFHAGGGSPGLMPKLNAATDEETQIDPFSTASQSGAQPLDVEAANTPGGRSSQASKEGGDKSANELFVLAKAAYADQKESRAIGYLMAEAVFHRNQEMLKLLRWSPELKRPVFAARWGLATTVFMMNTDLGEMPFIRPPQDGIFQFGSENNNAQPGGPVPGPNNAQQAQRNKRKPGQANPVPAAVQNLAQFGRYNVTGFWRQVVGDSLTAGLQKRMDRGQFGVWAPKLGTLPALGNVPNPMPGRQAPIGSGSMTPIHRPSADDSDSDSSSAPPVSVVSVLARRPGILVLQASNPAEPQAASVQEHLDFLLIADIAEKPLDRRHGLTQTIIQIHIYDVASDTELWKSRELSSAKVVMAARGVKGGGTTGDLATDVLRYIDRHFVLEKMPEITEEMMQERLAELAEKKPHNPLPALMELRYYEMIKLLTPHQFLEQALKIIEIEDARCLTGNDSAQQKEVIERWLSDGR